MVTFSEAAYQILSSNRYPMHSNQIIKSAINQGLINTQGKTPELTMVTKLLKEKTFDFRKIGNGYYGLSSNKDSLDDYLSIGIKSPWWLNDSKEKFWLEKIKLKTKDRRGSIEPGKYIFAPHFTVTNTPKRDSSYSLVNAVNKGDIVFHYVSEHKGIIGYSKVKSKYSKEEFWKGKLVDCFFADLEDYVPLENPVNLDHIRRAQKSIGRFYASNKEVIYKPFNLSSKVIGEGYLAKFPTGILMILNLMNDKYELLNKFTIKNRNDTYKYIKEKHKKSGNKNRSSVINSPYDRKNTENIPKDNDDKDDRKTDYDFFENELEKRFVDYLDQKEISTEIKTIPYEPNNSKFKCDLFLPEKNLLIEVKASTTPQNIRMAAGQIKHYNFLRKKMGDPPKLSAALFPEKPNDLDLKFLLDEGIFCIWAVRDDVFTDNLIEHLFK